ncbi:TBC domain-containing protein kinase-like protein [Centruroides sculpturatus]|uniref:TBC domain-containing protein kinase-like protein n=1 Tax=Centruroides sculpturatus TaxID=218467 RepID=UPI000C6DA25D|nr:TBC domain-containing protein kinase-like protein [Centruroides sculpturatus]
MIVSEYYLKNIQQKENRKILEENISDLALLTFETLDALEFLHKSNLIHRCLSPNCILLDSENHVKLANYGLYYMTECGACVSFPIGIPKYLAPETLMGDVPGKSDYSFPYPLPSGPKSDIWSLGIIILELVLGKELWEHCIIDEIFQEILLLVKLDSGQSVLYTIAKEHDVIQKLENMPSTLKSFLESCLTTDPLKRPNASKLLEHEFFKEHGLDDSHRIKIIKESFPSIELRCRSLILPKNVPII